MNKHIIINLLLPLLSTGWFGASAQPASDTVAMIKKFNEVMAFAVQPNVYYASTTTVRTMPSAQADSTGTLHGLFYKKGDDLYYGNELEEVFLQDSLMIKVQHQRKTVQVARVDMASKKNMDLLPLKRAEVQKMLRGRYAISETSLANGHGRLEIRPRENHGHGTTSTSMSVDYDVTSNVPTAMDITVKMRQPASGQMLETLKKQAGFSPAMLQEIDGSTFFVMEQSVHMHFMDIGTAPDKAPHMPLWTGELDYDAAHGTFTGKARCADYEVVKIF